MKSKSVFRWILLLMSLGVVARAEEVARIEKKKTIVKVYEANDRDHLMLDNQYGHVNVNLWDKKEIKVDIVITANCLSEEDVTNYLNSVKIEENKSGGQVRLKTVIDRKRYGGIWNSFKNVLNSKNSVRIDYSVNMPRNIALSVSNEFGDTNVPSFQAPLSIHTRYGSFFAQELDGPRNTIDVSYGKASIGKVNGGTMDIRYSDLAVDKAHHLTLVNKYGKLSIGQINALTADIDYSGGFHIGKLLESCTINLNYSGGFNIDELPQSANAVTIQAAYSSIAIPVESGNFDVTVSYGDVNFPKNGKTSFTSQPDGKSPTKQYEGKIGSGNGTRIKVISRYGSVNLAKD